MGRTLPVDSLLGMPISTQESHERIVGDLGAAAEQLALAVACLGEAYEQLSVMAADRMEADIYAPVQRALGRTKRTRSQFAERVGREASPIADPQTGRSSQGAKVFIERAAGATTQAGGLIADLQDTGMAIESGDAELRAGLSEIRDLLAPVPAQAREFLRTLGR